MKKLTVIFLILVILLPSLGIAEDNQVKQTWYESQIIGVIVGLIGGYLITLLHEIRKEWKLKKSLISGINTEVGVLREFLDSGAAQLRKYQSEISASGTVTKVYQLRGEMELSFLDRNLHNLGMLKPKYIKKLTELHSTLRIVSRSMDILRDTARGVLKANLSINLLNKQLMMAINTYDKMISLCNEILGSK